MLILKKYKKNIILKNIFLNNKIYLKTNINIILKFKTAPSLFFELHIKELNS
jgi:hypothetical protein